MNAQGPTILSFGIATLSGAVLVIIIIVSVLLAPDSAPSLSFSSSATMTTMYSCNSYGVKRRACDGSDHETHHWSGHARSDFVYVAKRSTPEQIGARPNARTVSNSLCVQPPNVGKSEVWSALAWSFGQFLDHAITLVAASSREEDAISIDVTGDATFDPNSGGATIKSGGVLPHNLITHFVDGNVLYGSDVRTIAELRAWEGGRLLLNEDGLPPKNDEGTARRIGDVRGNEHPVLLALHSLFAFEHNYQADRMAAQHPLWNDECLFNAARVLVESEVRSIVFDDFVPALLGEPLPEAHFNDSCSVQIAAEFAGAAYRLHSLVGDRLKAYNVSSGEHVDTILLSDAFDKNDFIEKHGVGSLLLGQVLDSSEALDLHLVDSLRQHLFPMMNMPLDLAALNIERGRRLELADFSALRKTYRPDAGVVENWTDLGAAPAVEAELRVLYSSYRNIDAWVGLMAEQVGDGERLPPTLKAVLREQFVRLRDCDPLYFKEPYSGVDRAYINAHGSLRSIILRNTNIDEKLLPEAGKSLFER